MELGILLWVGLILICIFVFGSRILAHKRIQEGGIETIATVSKIEETRDLDTYSTDYIYYVEYIDQDNQKQVSELLNTEDLNVGDQVRIKYDPKKNKFAKLIEKV